MSSAVKQRKRTGGTVIQKRDEKPPVATVSKPKDQKKTYRKILVRTVFGFLMIFVFGGFLYAGHIYIWLLVVVLQTIIFRELVAVRYKAVKENELPWFRSVQWCWFAVAMFYTYGDAFCGFLKNHEGPKLPAFAAVYLRYHPWISFTSYALLFVMSVLSLKKGFYKYQMGQFTWTAVMLALIVFQLKYILVNIFNGLFWFVFPASLVVCNDVSAYFWGISCGRKFVSRPFLKLSPNKTWEGFMGAFFSTCVYAFLSSAIYSQYQWLICPLDELRLVPETLSCEPALVFQPTLYDVPDILSSYTGMTTVILKPIQLHGIVFGIFASLVAPFGGFYASAIKRAYKIKDFDSVIPGHGGMMDRMDCQYITALFTSVYYSTFIKPVALSLAVIVNSISKLSREEKRQLLEQLQTSLE